MTSTIIIIILIAVVVILIAVLNKKKALRQAQDKIIGICEVALENQAKKRTNLDKILAMLTERSEVSNSDIRERFGFSERSVVRYMDELEKEGKVEQIGNTGRGVIYRLK